MNILLDPLAHPVIGHRGNRAYAPENTIEAFQQAIALGADAVEFDLHASRDGVLVVIHDATLERTTNAAGAVNRYTAAELRAVDAGARFSADGGRTFPYRAHGIGVPSFDDVVEAVRDIPMIIELKTAATTALVRAAIARHNIAARVVVAGFDARAVHPLRGAGFALGATTRDGLRLLPVALLHRTARMPQFQTVNFPPTWHGVRVPFGLITRSLRPAGVPVHVWTVNETAEAERLWDAGVCGIISDDPAAIMVARDARFGSSRVESR